MNRAAGSFHGIRSLSLATLFAALAAVVVIHPLQGGGQTLVKAPGRLPDPLRFHLAVERAPKDDGVFIGRCYLEAPLCDLELEVTITPSDGVELLRGRRIRRALLRKGQTRILRIPCRIGNGASKPAGVSVRARYVMPFKGLAAYVRKDPHGHYGTRPRKVAALASLRQIVTSGNRRQRRYRCLLF